MNMTVQKPVTAMTTGPVHQIDALVLNCMDYRLVGAIADYLEGRGLRGRYDQIALSGGAIGVMSDQTTAWADTFWQHVALAREKHNIHKIIIIDHRDCGACNGFAGQDRSEARGFETATHMKWMEALTDEIKTRHPQLDVEMVLMDLDGSVETFDP